MNRLILNTDFIKIALVWVFFAFLAPVFSIAQTSTFTVSGIVKGGDGVPLPSASVYTTEDTKFGASTDSQGKFRIDLPHAGPWTVKCSMVGCVSKESLLEFEGTTNKSIKIILILSKGRELRRPS